MPHCESPTAEVLRTGVPLRNRELVIGRPDGSRVPVLANVVPLRDPEGSMIAAVSCYQDITERKQAEEKLQESNDNRPCSKFTSSRAIRLFRASSVNQQFCP